MVNTVHAFQYFVAGPAERLLPLSSGGCARTVSEARLEPVWYAVQFMVCAALGWTSSRLIGRLLIRAQPVVVDHYLYQFAESRTESAVHDGVVEGGPLSTTLCGDESGLTGLLWSI